MRHYLKDGCGCVAVIWMEREYSDPQLDEIQHCPTHGGRVKQKKVERLDRKDANA